MDELKVFELSPVEDRRDNHNWKASIYKGKATFVAKDERQARMLAGRSFACAVALVPGEPMAANPWSIKGLVSCIEVEDIFIEKDNARLVYPAEYV